MGSLLACTSCRLSSYAVPREIPRMSVEVEEHSDDETIFAQNKISR